MTLRLVRDEPPKPSRRKGRRSPAIILLREAQGRVRAAVRSLHLGHGAWSVVAELTGMSINSLTCIANGRRPVTPEVLLRIAAAGGLSVDALLQQKLTDTGRCPSCGARRVAS